MNIEGVEVSSLDQEKREKILRSAKELFGRFGFKKTTVDEIAEDAGVSKRTMYEVFSSKEKILGDLVLAEARAFRRMGLNQMKTLDDPAEKLRLLCDLSAGYFDETPFLGQVLADDAGLYAPFLGNVIQVVEDGMRLILAGILEEGIAKGVFRPMPVTATASIVFVLYRGFTYRRTAAEQGGQEWVAFLLRAIRAEA